MVRDVTNESHPEYWHLIDDAKAERLVHQQLLDAAGEFSDAIRKGTVTEENLKKLDWAIGASYALIDGPDDMEPLVC